MFGDSRAVAHCATHDVDYRRSDSLIGIEVLLSRGMQQR
jgi:hypothetical protein